MGEVNGPGTKYHAIQICRVLGDKSSYIIEYPVVDNLAEIRSSTVLGDYE
jgi:hypothetical protein